MNNFGKTIIKISLIIIPIVFSYSSSFANDIVRVVDENDSMYKYSALENKISFYNNKDTRNVENPKENSLEINTSINDDEKKLKNIIEKQTNYIEKSESFMKNIENRSWIRNFILGNNVSVLKSQMVQIKDQSHALSILALNATDDKVKSQIDSQIHLSLQQQSKIDDFIAEKGKGVNMFGWIINTL